MSATIRVGLGKSLSGKTLDYGTQWYLYDVRKGIDERMAAIKFAEETKREIFVSDNKSGYFEVSKERLMRLWKET